MVWDVARLLRAGYRNVVIFRLTLLTWIDPFELPSAALDCWNLEWMTTALRKDTLLLLDVFSLHSLVEVGLCCKTTSFSPSSNEGKGISQVHSLFQKRNSAYCHRPVSLRQRRVWGIQINLFNPNWNFSSGYGDINCQMQ